MGKLRIPFDEPTPIPVGYSVRFRLKGSSGAYTTVGPLTRTGGAVTVQHVNIEFGKDYEGFIQSICDSTNSPEVPFSSDEYEWVPGAGYCEQDSVYTQTGQVVPMSSPMLLHYDSTSGLVYGVDADNTSGNFFRYNPTGFDVPADITYTPMILKPGSQNYVYASAVDGENRKIYAVGKDSDGIQVMNMVNNTVSVIACGPNHNVTPSQAGNGYNRLFLIINDTQIVTYNTYNKTFYFVNRNASTIVNTKVIDFGANGTVWLMEFIGGEYWVCGANSSNINIYNSTLSTIIGTINLGPHSALWTNGIFWKSFYRDKIRNKLYCIDYGASKLIVINTTTKLVEFFYTFTNRLGKSNTAAQFFENPITKKFYISGVFSNDANTDLASKNFTYEFDRDTNTFTRYFKGLSLTGLTRIGLTNILHGPSAGLTAWAGGAWNTDGAIKLFTS